MRGIWRLIVVFLSFLLIFPNSSYSFSLPKPFPGENQSISIVGSTVRIKGLTSQRNKASINGQEVLIQPDGSFNEEVIIPLGEVEIVVRVVNPEGEANQYIKKITAKENHFFMTGIADGTLNFYDSASTFHQKRDSKRRENGFTSDGKVSYYAVGKLQGKYLFKSALDTDKTTQDKLFTYIDRDKYYPIYGDNSTVVYDVNSQGPFYALFEWDKSGAVFGNYQTQIGEEDSKLLNYNRTLYGAKIHMETPKKTVYGDPLTKITGFAAEANQHAGHSELLATGGSLYYLRHRNILEGSEQVRIEVRDKVSGMTISSEDQAHLVDYEMKYDEGRILFKKPILSITPSDTIISTSILEGNPVYIVVNYEYKNQEAFPMTLEDLDNKTGGLRLSQQFGHYLRGGFTHVHEERDGKHYRLSGADSTVKLGNFTKLNAEIARSTADNASSYISYNGGYDYTTVSTVNLEDGLAMRVEANSSLGEYIGKEKGFLDFSGYWQKISRNFSPTDTLFEAGSRKFGLDFSHQLTPDDQLRILFERSEVEPQTQTDNPAVENQLQAQRVELLTGQWIHHWEKFDFTSEYQFRNEAEAKGPITDGGKGRVKGHILGERVTYHWSEKTSLHLGQQLGITDINDSFTTTGFSRKVSDKLSVHGQVGAGPLGNSVLAGIERNTGPKSSDYWNYTLANSAIDGKTSITSFGSNSQISETAKLRRERQFVTSDTRGVYRADLMGYEHQITPELAFDATYQRRDEKQDPLTIDSSEARDATAARLSYILPDKLKFYSKAEHRLNSNDLWQVLVDNEAEFKLTQDIFLFGEHEFSKAKKSLSRIEKFQVALAFRPVHFDWFNALVKFIRFNDHRPENLGSADGGFLEVESDSNVIAAEYALDLPLRFQVVQKLAFKDEESIAINPTATIRSPDDLQAFLWIHRLNYHLTNRIDIAGEYRTLRQEGLLVQQNESGVLFELTFQIVKHIAIGAGLNFTSFSEDLTAQDDRNNKGFFLRLQGKY
ncbi:MAG: hypothetical protein HYS55_06080 [Candidatus Omnitrophica bacterium]|nr:hypothetical protein [Candidatus Omnitrophota bacterium]